MKQHNESHDKDNRWHCVNNLNTHFLTCAKVQQVGIWKMPERFAETNMSVLLAGFFTFYARIFPRHSTAVSIRLGKCVLQKSVFKSARLWRFCIEDPFETHYSYCPHDLGTPMNEYGQTRVTRALRDAADQMDRMFINCWKIEDCIGSAIHTREQSPEDNTNIAKHVDREHKHNFHRDNRSHQRRVQHGNSKRESRRNKNHPKRKGHNGPIKPEKHQNKDNRKEHKERKIPSGQHPRTVRPQGEVNQNSTAIHHQRDLKKQEQSDQKAPLLQHQKRERRRGRQKVNNAAAHQDTKEQQNNKATESDTRANNTEHISQSNKSDVVKKKRRRNRNRKGNQTSEDAQKPKGEEGQN
mmetsp:Transcript_14205/g.21518  ORF Transcript_14205/g.21518 Transcript_14205/m.21518 type:complete len:353 (-) Transcript_14205:133-1191(-)